MSQSHRRRFRLQSSFTAVAVTAAVLASGIMGTIAHAQSPRVRDSATSQLIYEGFTEPKYDIMVAAMEIGRLESLLVKIGDEVVAGQIAGQLENSLQKSAVRIAELQSNLKGELEGSRAEVELHESRTALLRQLAKDRMARPDELARAETDLRVAKAKLLTVEEQNKLRKLEFERYRLQLERRSVRIPMNGVISEVFHHPGEYITPSEPAIVRLLVLDTLYGVFNIPVEEAKTIRVGTQTRVFLRSEGKTINATISSISPAIDGESGTVQLRVELENSKRTLRAGDRCTLRILPTDLRRASQPRGVIRQ
ncbi:MAG: efflux RND transporter periplasmic adaptor subunit [Rubripirellula sp.]|nr:efflux RND transporter periplasmic adaptor subunit [Rubripirellula sp.]